MLNSEFRGLGSRPGGEKGQSVVLEIWKSGLSLAGGVGGHFAQVQVSPFMNLQVSGSL